MVRIYAVVFALSLIGLSASAETWRVVYNDFPPYSNTAENGDPVGFAIDVLQSAARGLDVNLEYIRAENTGEALRMIEEGEADLHPHLAPNPQRAEIMSFTRSIKSFQVRAYKRKDAPAPEDLVTFAGASIGVSAGSLPDYIASALPGSHVVRIVNNSELFFALAKGEVDVAFYADNSFEDLVLSLGVEGNFVPIGTALTTRNVSMGVSLARPDIASALDTELGELVDTTAYWAIHAAWFGSHRLFWTPVMIASLAGSFLALCLITVLGTYVYMRFQARMQAAMIAEHNLEEQNKLIVLLEMRNKDLEVSTRDMQEMLSVVSHDLKSPLVSISGFAEVLKEALETGGEKADDTLVDMAVSRIQSNIEHMRRMIGNILELRKLDLSHTRPSSFSINEMLEEIRIGLAHNLDHDNVTLEIPDLGDINGDRSLIQRAFQNLMENALRHGITKDGLKMEVLKMDEEDAILLGLRDNGLGVPADRRKSIFELHKRLEKAGDGLGIGLGVVRRVVQAHAGQAWVEETPGGGATFWMRFAKEPWLEPAGTRPDVAA